MSTVKYPITANTVNINGKIHTLRFHIWCEKGLMVVDHTDWHLCGVSSVLHSW